MEFLKKWANYIIACACAFIMIVMGFFHVIRGDGYSANAFDLFSTNNVMLIFCGVIAIVGIVLGIFSLIRIANEIFVNKGKTTFIPIMALTLTFIYLVVGIIAIKGYPTLVFLPFIIELVLAVLYFICANFLPDYELKKDAKTGEYGEVSKAYIKKQILAVELIKEYKGLLDDGIITKEEFDEKKAQLIK